MLQPGPSTAWQVRAGLDGKGFRPWNFVCSGLRNSIYQAGTVGGIFASHRVSIGAYSSSDESARSRRSGIRLRGNTMANESSTQTWESRVREAAAHAEADVQRV